MQKITKIILGVVVVLIIVGGIWYGSTRQTGNEGLIKIGVLTPLTGQVAEYGENTKKGIELAVEEINNGGGVKGKKIQLFYEDSKCDAKEAVNGFNNLITQDAKIVLGTVCSGETLAVAPLANDKKIIVISSGASSPQITAAGDYIFRVYPSDDYEAGIAADTIFNQLKKTNVSILYVNNDYGVALKETFKNKFSKMGGKVLNEETYLQNDKDFKTQLTKIKENKPDIIYMISYPIDGALIMKQAKELGVAGIFFGTSGLKANDFIANGGLTTEGFILVAPAEISSNKTQSFVQKYTNKFGSKPGLLSDRAYDSVYILKDVLEKVRNVKNIEEIKNNLYKIKGFVGASGEMSFNSNGDIVGTAYNLLTIKNGQFVSYEGNK
jgi:branched-chain amino acid transport system substrate-binding protein